MTLPSINYNASDRLVGALCNTLVHSLWQGVLLAAIAGLIVTCTRRTSSALRYNLLISALLLFAIGIGITFAWQYQSSPVTGAGIPPVPHINGYAANVHVQPVHIFLNGQEQSLPGFPQNLNSYLSEHDNIIVFIWFLIICARSLQLSFGLYGTYRLRRIRVTAVKGNWPQRMQQLADALGIKQTITLLESGLAKVPMMIGHLKPVVLVPIGLLTALSAEEVEAILIHELAHIKRRDYLVNMLQSLMEIFFFFNPAVLWVSTLIKTERENCCDDIVVAQTDSKVSYIKALVSCQEYQSAIPVYAMGLGGDKGHFLQRVKRMLSNSNQTLNKVEKMVLTICLISAVLLTAAFSKSGKMSAIVKTSAKRSSSIHSVTKTDSSIRITSIKNDSLNVGSGKIRIYKPGEVADGTVMRRHESIGGKLYAIFVIKNEGTVYQSIGLDDGSKTNYYINAKPVSKAQFAQNRPLFDRMISESDGLGAKLPAQLGGLQHNGGTGEIVDSADIKARDQLKFEQSVDLAKANGVLDSLKKANRGARGLGSTKGNLGKLNGSLNQLDTQRAIAAYKLAIMDSTGQGWHKTPIKPKSYPYSYNKPYKPYGNKAYPTEPKEPVEPNTTATTPTLAKAYGSYHSTPGTPPSPVSTVGDGITNQLINDHLIKDKSNYTFKITNDELYIDGVKQPDEVHKRIVEKYLKPGDTINYTRTNKTTK